MKGGDSGLDPLSLPIEKNELLRRLRSTEPGDRMPLEGDPLDETKIALVESWIRQGAPWPEPPAKNLPAYEPVWWEVWATKLLNLYDRWHGPTLKPAVPVFVLVLFGILLLERGREARRIRLKKGDAAGPPSRIETLAGVSRAWGLVGLLLVVILGGSLVVRERLKEVPVLKSEVKRLGELVATSDPFPDRRVRPVHPPRMGGKYYRGNDERSPALFNGGYYRTATLDLQIHGPDGRPLIWGDPSPATATIVVEIEKSPFAAPSLFTGEMMAAVGMTDVEPKELGSAVKPRYTLLKPAPREGAWMIEFPLELHPDQPRQEGYVYLYNSFHEQGEGLSGTCHFAIGYTLVTADGKLTPESQVWMEAAVKPGQLHWTPEGRISAQEWFDVLPIPEIEGGNSSDPKLLGVEEHLKKLRKLRDDQERNRKREGKPDEPRSETKAPDAEPSPKD